MAAAAEWEEYTPYYEDDAWYDISEWFDGNDYNPTDEEILEWDDERYQFDADEVDRDNDRSYGYYDGDDGSFYDYYDYGASDGYGLYDPTYRSGFRYYDFDGDGTYDAYAAWADWDADGLFEDYEYYSFADDSEESSKSKQQAQQEAPTSAKAAELTGPIGFTKEVDVRGKKHLVVSVKQDGKSIAADLGPIDRLSEENQKLKTGDEITVKGIQSKVGDKHVVLAQQLNAHGEQTTIDRSSKQLQGQVVETRKAKIAGTQHLIAMVENDEGKKVAVDFGPADRLDMELAKGDELTFTGVPVKIRTKRMLMAHSLEHDGKTVQIKRGPQSKDS
ncbi:MAG: hypothetical protein DWQ37_16370 [Planctomycetota bacterium]|nr:MAG: hypothetical protein DWQ37_16370 [Planctomycetota bacterium]